MELEIIDWAIIIVFLALSLAIGLSFKNKASVSLADFFLGGRNLPWYVAGISMVATTFAADTPLAVSEMVADQGIAKNWVWWSFLAGGMLTTFFFAHLWRKANILTELEFISLRYTGKPARFLRIFKSVYLGIFMNSLIIGWVNLAFASILSHFFGVEQDMLWYVLFASMLFAAAYSTVSGLLGVAITDTIQFVIAIVGTMLLAFFVLDAPEVGGVMELKSALPQEYFQFYPSFEGEGNALYTISVGAFLGFILAQWWASWYPGSEPGGGGYIAQRIMSTRSQKDSQKATLLFQVLHYCLRPWPWIIVALAAVMLYDPHYADPSNPIIAQIEALLAQDVSFEQAIRELGLTQGSPNYLYAEYMYQPRVGYLRAMDSFLPTGMKGLLLVAFISAYLSTISTQLNMGASFIVNDFYIPLFGKEKSQKQLVKIGRIATLVLMVIGLAVTSQIQSISGVWEFILEAGAGLGAVLILRWYWWRVNAWSEIAAMLSPFVGYAIGHYILDDAMGEAFQNQNGAYWFTVVFSSAVWIVITYVTKPEPQQVLNAFYKRVEPQGWWSPIRMQLGVASNNQGMKWRFSAWFSAVFMAYGILFATGKIIFQEWNSAIFWSVIAVVSLVVLVKSMKQLKD